jgi:hypothetical protein
LAAAPYKLAGLDLARITVALGVLLGVLVVALIT